MALSRERFNYLYDVYRRKAKAQDRSVMLSRDDFLKLMYYTKTTGEGLAQIDYFLELMREGLGDNDGNTIRES